MLLVGMYVAAVYVGRGQHNMHARPPSTMGHDIHLVIHGRNQYPDFLCYGAVCTIVCTGAVIWTYLRHKVWRVHPGPLIFYRSVADLLFGIVFLVSSLNEEMDDKNDAHLLRGSCRWNAATVQLSALSSEGWFFMTSLDLIVSLTNPFTSYKQNVKRYHAFVWGTGLLSAAMLVVNMDVGGSMRSIAAMGDADFCWTSRQKDAILLFYSWILLYYSFALGAFAFGYYRLRAGLTETIKTRQRVLKSAGNYILLCSVYWTVVLVLFYLRSRYARSSRRFMQWSNVFGFVLAAKGAVDAAAWFSSVDFAACCDTVGSKSLEDLELDVAPQVNRALRREVLHQVTFGITKSARLAPIHVEHPPPQHVNNGASKTSLELEAEPGRFVQFCSYEPNLFFALRRDVFKISTEQYTTSLAQTTKEQLSEGASGAFLFYSSDMRFIVKSTSRAECKQLRRMIRDYQLFLRRSPGSLLTKFCGCHSVRMYTQKFYFVVMLNHFAAASEMGLLPTTVYDVKGSWVGRNAHAVVRGKRATCRHCGAAFVIGQRRSSGQPQSVEPCPHLASGGHEPAVTMQDNDLTTKVRLQQGKTHELIEQLRNDSDFLCSQGIMDYSLLLGVHHVECAIEEDLDLRTSVVGLRSASTLTARNASSTSTMLHSASGPLVANSDASSHAQMSNNDSGSMDSPRRIQSNFASIGEEIEAVGVRARSVVGPGYYYLGIIDVLQAWTWRKRLERFCKRFFLMQDGDGISAIEPEAYKQRFQQKIIQIIDHQGFVREV